MESKPVIAEWFKGKDVFITGATGFMGKVLVIKLLNECPEIGKIFMLVREKKGVLPQARLQTLLQQEPFKSLQQTHPFKVKKLVVVSGDSTMKDLGLSETDKSILAEEVSVIFHMAANVRFDLPLKTAITMNTKGTANALAFAKQIQRLKAFVHVSTSFCQCGEEVLEERAYQTAVTPESVISMVENETEDRLKEMTPKLLGDQPNTYAFSKALSEDLVVRSGLPAGVARPSIVTASWKEPFPGWVENMNGPTGLMIGAGKGVIRSMLMRGDDYLPLIPCDIAVNGIISLAWKVGLEQPDEPIFMNISETGSNPILWRYAIEVGRKHVYDYPFSDVLWYPGGSITSSKVIFWVNSILFHLLPAYILDGLIMLTGNKPFLVRVQGRISAGLDLLKYYTTKDWIFRTDVLKKLQDELSPEDRKAFPMDCTDVCWNEYLMNYILGIRKYCLKDDPSTLPQARRVMNYLYIADRFVKLILGLFIVWLIYSRFTSVPSRNKTLVEIDDL
ncbi:putative fatty acyl-CoA reductase CG5065 [Orussus abietinus]|uniref:putative fatty acyl-CoA reductase CG5065 n=1 Tax=Orussus abietinus TaxID=222816 RepID=UPI0006255208|nr:putative fatty acyl-CoA reductase CG5065 [Orussus abietinus]